MSIPLIHLTKKDVAWSWTDKEEQAFKEIKAAVTSAPCLALIDYADESNELFLYTDISLVGLSGILVVYNEGLQCPVAFHSHKLNGAEVNYSTTERELLAIVDSLQ